MNFSDIIGHKDVIHSLNRVLLETKVGHAYLFIGPPGIGKKTLSKAFAKKLLCQNSTEVKCPGCRSCVLFDTETHPDFITVSPSGNSIKIEQLRELQHNMYLSRLSGNYRVFFFPDAEQLTEAAANSFLKLLEEPPGGVVFLFTAVRADRILPTIRSRCQVYTLFPVSAAMISIWLQDKGFETMEAQRRSLSCEGLPGKALILEGPILETERIIFKNLLGQDLLKQLKFANDLEKKERQAVLKLIHDWESQMRQELLSTLNAGSALDLDRLKLGIQVRIIEKLVQVERMIESNVNPRLAVEELLTDLTVQIL